MMNPPANRKQLWSFVLTHFGVALPHRTFTPSHSSPFGFVADAFFHPGTDVAAWANRSGGKTLGASILAALEFLFNDHLQGRVLSGSEDQARNLYDYWSRWCHGPLAERIEGEVRRQLTQVAGGRLEILAASQKRVRGPKVHRLYEDELDEIDRDIDTAAVGMIASADGLPGRTVYTSTWHRADGPMAALIEACPDNGVSLHKWNLWESIEQCPPRRHDHGRGCRTCPLAGACLAKAEEVNRSQIPAGPDRGDDCVGIAAEAMGLYRIDDAIKAFSKLGRAAWEAEFECRRPRTEGLVYPQFDPLVHRCEKPPAELTIYRAIDWGHGVFVCLWLGEDKDGATYLLDTYRAELGTIHQHAATIKAHRLKNVRDTYCDPAGRNRNDQTGRSNVEIFGEYGIRCSYTLSPKAREIRNGIELVRGELMSAAGRPRFFFLPNQSSRIFVKAMQSYHNRKVNGVWLDEPQDPQEFEHIPDALRYYFVNRRHGSSIGVVRLRAT